MAKGRYRRKKGIPGIALLAIFVIIAINIYALHELALVAQSWKASILPRSVATQLIQLAVILGINCVIIVYLLVDRFNR